MNFDDFLWEIRHTGGVKKISFVADYLEDYEQYEMEACTEANDAVYLHAHKELSVTKAPALIRMSLHDESYVEDYGQGGTFIYDDEAFGKYRKLITHLYKYQKEHTREQLKFTFAPDDDYDKHAENKMDDFDLNSYNYNDFSDIQYKNISDTYKRLDDIEKKYEEANNVISMNDRDWYVEATKKSLEDVQLTNKDDAKRAFMKWIFEEYL